MSASKMIRVDIREVMSKARRLGESYPSSSFVLAPDTLTYLNLMLDKQEEINRRCAGLENGTLELTFPFDADLKQGTVEVIHGQVEIKRYLKIEEQKKQKVVFQFVNVIVGMPAFRAKIKRAREAETWVNLNRLSSDDKLFFTEMIEGARSKDRKAAKKKIEQTYKDLGITISEDSLEVFIDGEKHAAEA